jgi:hypothetical protein
MESDFARYKVADGFIKKIVVDGANAYVHLQTWQEKMETFAFIDVIGLEALGAIGESLSHGTETASDPFLIRCCEAENVPAEEFRCFGFASAWTNTVVLRIVARSARADGEAQCL